MKTAPEIKLQPEEREQLRKIVRAGKSSARVQARARILLLAARRGVNGEGGTTRRSNSNQRIAEVVLVSARTVSRVRQRFIKAGLNAALYDLERTGRPTEIDGEAEAKLIMLACSQPPEDRSHWTLQLLADRMVALGYTEHISDTWVLNLLKKTNCDLGQSKVGVFPKSAPVLLPRWKMF
jgi:transposase